VPAPSRRLGRRIGGAVLTGLIAIGLAGCGGSASTSSGGSPLHVPNGKTIFEDNCGMCHALADAKTNATAGPNLDVARPTKSETVGAVTNGAPGMPAYKHKLSEAEIQAVAEYVVSAAGKSGS